MSFPSNGVYFRYNTYFVNRLFVEITHAVSAEYLPDDVRVLSPYTNTIEWDGDTTGKLTVSDDANWIKPALVKVSDVIITPDQVEGYTPTECENGWYCVATNGGFACAYEPNTKFSGMMYGLANLEVPEPGIYFVKYEQGEVFFQRKLSYTVKQIRPDLLPDTVATKEYVDSAIGSKTTEEWTFTLEDGSTVTKTVVIG
jgi:hypothetical protein